jgi:hypothetical protein
MEIRMMYHNETKIQAVAIHASSASPNHPSADTPSDTTMTERGRDIDGSHIRIKNSICFDRIHALLSSIGARILFRLCVTCTTHATLDVSPPHMWPTPPDAQQRHTSLLSQSHTHTRTGLQAQDYELLVQ